MLYLVAGLGGVLIGVAVTFWFDNMGAAPKEAILYKPISLQSARICPEDDYIFNGDRCPWCMSQGVSIAYALNNVTSRSFTTRFKEIDNVKALAS